jgi:hypothetical protein
MLVNFHLRQDHLHLPQDRLHLRQDHLHLRQDHLYPTAQYLCTPTYFLQWMLGNAQFVFARQHLQWMLGMRNTFVHQRLEAAQQTKASEPSSPQNESERTNFTAEARQVVSVGGNLPDTDPVQATGAAELSGECERTLRQDPDRSPGPPPPPLPALAARHRSPHLPVAACPCAHTRDHARIRIQ